MNIICSVLAAITVFPYAVFEFFKMMCFNLWDSREEIVDSISGVLSFICEKLFVLFLFTGFVTATVTTFVLNEIQERINAYDSIKDAFRMVPALQVVRQPVA